MGTLRYGALMIDRETREVWGDADHCSVTDLMDSAEALWDVGKSLDKSVWGIGKAYDGDCYVFVRGKRRTVPSALPVAEPGYFPRAPRWTSIPGPEKKIQPYFKRVGKLP